VSYKSKVTTSKCGSKKHNDLLKLHFFGLDNEQLGVGAVFSF